MQGENAEGEKRRERERERERERGKARDQPAFLVISAASRYLQLSRADAGIREARLKNFNFAEQSSRTA